MFRAVRIRFQGKGEVYNPEFLDPFEGGLENREAEFVPGGRGGVCGWLAQLLGVAGPWPVDMLGSGEVEMGSLLGGGIYLVTHERVA